MPRLSVPLARKSSPEDAGAVSAERLINLYPEKTDSPATEGFFLRRSPGLTEFADTGGAHCRGMIELDDRIISVHPQSIYDIREDGTATRVGNIPGSDLVIMDRNDARIDGAKVPQVAITADSGAWIYRDGSLISVPVPSGFPAPNSVVYIDGYFVFTFTDGRIIWTGINDALSIDALDFATAEGDPDGLYRALRVRRELALMGPKSVEIWTNTGDANSTFARLPGAVVDIGLIARHAAAVMAGVLYWVDEFRIVRRLGNGYQPERISNNGVERALKGLADTSTLWCRSYIDEGHEFLVVSCASFTWVFDGKTGLWHERESYGYSRWQAQGFARAFGKHIVGTSLGGKIFELSESARDEDGDVQIVTARFPVLQSFPDGGVIDAFNLNVKAGVGLLDGNATEDVDPEVMLRWSVDGGNTWIGNRKEKLGKQSVFNKEVRFTRLGRFQAAGVIFEVSCSARVVTDFISAYMVARKIAA